MAKKPKPLAGFTLVELLVGSTLAAMIMLSLLSSYLFLGRNLSRLANQQLLETQSRRALLYFSQDVRMASALSSPSATGMVLTVPTSSGTTTVTYAYDSAAQTLTRTIGSIPAKTLLTELVSFSFHYYDGSSNEVTSFSTQVISIKRVAMTFTSQTGVSSNGTQTPVYQFASPYLVIRNKSLLY